jgi:hypothetical protein
MASVLDQTPVIWCPDRNGLFTPLILMGLKSAKFTAPKSTNPEIYAEAKNPCFALAYEHLLVRQGLVLTPHECESARMLSLG